MIFISLLLPLVVSAGVLEKRQFGGLGLFSPAAKLAGVDKLEPQYRKTAQRTLTKFGPYTLSGATTGGGEMGGMGGMGDSTLRGNMFFSSIRNGFCNEKGPCTVLAGKVGVSFVDGSKADPSTGIYIHHILTADTTKKQSPWLSRCAAPNSAGRSISAMGGTAFVGTGEDNAGGMTMYTSTDGTRESGFHINRGDSFFVNAQLVNYNKAPKQVYITYDLEWIPGTQGQDMKNSLISISQCGPQIKLSASGPTNTTSGKFYLMEDGKIVGARGHLHDGGVQMDMFVNGKYVCSSKATYGSRGEGGHSHGGAAGGDAAIKTISSMSYCEDAIAVKKGDALSMNVQYDLQKYPLRKSAGGHEAGVMGMWALQFAGA